MPVELAALLDSAGMGYLDLMTRTTATSATTASAISAAVEVPPPPMLPNEFDALAEEDAMSEEPPSISLAFENEHQDKPDHDDNAADDQIQSRLGLRRFSVRLRCGCGGCCVVPGRGSCRIRIRAGGISAKPEVEDVVQQRA